MIDLLQTYSLHAEDMRLYDVGGGSKYNFQSLFQITISSQRTVRRENSPCITRH